MMRGVPALAVLVAGAVVAMVPRPGDAQEPGVTLRGTVLDSLLAPVPDVVVRL
ncbi:MAG: hypothetical protein GTO22_14205, partial [Gemmatimonadales bacterium]|nr:hypothetical protein [Gemmatimonadales bacterium]